MTSVATLFMSAALFQRKSRSFEDELAVIRYDALAIPGGEIDSAMQMSAVDDGPAGAAWIEGAEAELAGGFPAEQVVNARELQEQPDDASWPVPPPPPEAEVATPDHSADLAGDESRNDEWWAEPAPHPIRPSEMWHPAVTPSSLSPEGVPPREQRIESADLAASGSTGSRRFARFRPKQTVDGSAPPPSTAPPIGTRAQPAAGPRPDSPAAQPWSGWTDTHIERTPVPTEAFLPPVPAVAPAASTPSFEDALAASFEAAAPATTAPVDDTLWHPPAAEHDVAAPPPPPPPPPVIGPEAEDGGLLDSLLAPYEVSEPVRSAEPVTAFETPAVAAPAAEAHPAGATGLLDSPVGRRPSDFVRHLDLDGPLRASTGPEERSPLPEPELPPAAPPRFGQGRTGLPTPSAPVGRLAEDEPSIDRAPAAPVTDPFAAQVSSPVPSVSANRSTGLPTPAGFIAPTPEPEPDVAPQPVAWDNRNQLDVIAPLVRLSDGGRATGATSVEGHEVLLEEGWVWVAPHAASGRSAPVAIGIGSSIVSITEGSTVLTLLESDGTIFVVVVEGDADLMVGGRPYMLGIGSMAMFPPVGDPDLGEATREEIESDPIVARNRELDAAV